MKLLGILNTKLVMPCLQQSELKMLWQTQAEHHSCHTDQTHKAITESGKVAEGGQISSVHMQVLKPHRNP